MNYQEQKIVSFFDELDSIKSAGIAVPKASGVMGRWGELLSGKRREALSSQFAKGMGHEGAGGPLGRVKDWGSPGGKATFEVNPEGKEVLDTFRSEKRKVLGARIGTGVGALGLGAGAVHMATSPDGAR
jgi:hypothetical protein